MNKHLCPRCGGSTFHTVAHVTQTWEVDEFGNYIATVTDCDETTHGPDNGNIWTCAVCNTDAIIVPYGATPFTVPEKWAKKAPEDVVMDLTFQDADGVPHHISDSVRSVYSDWMGNAENCPENEVILDMLTLRDKAGKEIAVQPYMSFDGIMEAVAIAWPNMAREYISPREYKLLHELYALLAKLQANLRGAPNHEVEYMRRELAVRGLDPDKEPVFLRQYCPGNHSTSIPEYQEVL